MADLDKERVDQLLDRIETLVGEFPDRSGPNAILIAEIIQAVNGLRSLLGVVEAH